MREVLCHQCNIEMMQGIIHLSATEELEVYFCPGCGEGFKAEDLEDEGP